MRGPSDNASITRSDSSSSLGAALPKSERVTQDHEREADDRQELDDRWGPVVHESGNAQPSRNYRGDPIAMQSVRLLSEGLHYFFFFPLWPYLPRSALWNSFATLCGMPAFLAKSGLCAAALMNFFCLALLLGTSARSV